MAFGVLWRNEQGQLTRNGTQTDLFGISFFSGPWILALSESRYREWCGWIRSKGFNLIRIWPNWYWGLRVERTGNLAGEGISCLSGRKVGPHPRACIWVPTDVDMGSPTYDWGLDAMNPGYYNPDYWPNGTTNQNRTPPKAYHPDYYAQTWALGVSDGAHNNLCRAISIANEYDLAVDLTLWRYTVGITPYGYGQYCDSNGNGWWQNFYAAKYYSITGNYVQQATDPSTGETTWDYSGGRTRWKNLVRYTLAYLADPTNWPNNTIARNWYVDLNNECDGYQHQGCYYTTASDLYELHKGPNGVIQAFTAVGWRPLVGASTCTNLARNPDHYTDTTSWWDESLSGANFWEESFWSGDPTSSEKIGQLIRADGTWFSGGAWGSGTAGSSSSSYHFDSRRTFLSVQWNVHRYVGSAAYGGAELDLYIPHGVSEWTKGLLGFNAANTVNVMRHALDTLSHSPNSLPGTKVPIVVNETHRVNKFWRSSWRMAPEVGRWDLPHQQLISEHLGQYMAGDPNKHSISGSVYHTEATFDVTQRTIDFDELTDQSSRIYAPESMLQRGSLANLATTPPADIVAFEAVASPGLGWFWWVANWGGGELEAVYRLAQNTVGSSITYDAQENDCGGYNYDEDTAGADDGNLSANFCRKEDYAALEGKWVVDEGTPAHNVADWINEGRPGYSHGFPGGRKKDWMGDGGQEISWIGRINVEAIPPSQEVLLVKIDGDTWYSEDTPYNISSGVGGNSPIEEGIIARVREAFPTVTLEDYQFRDVSVLFPDAMWAVGNDVEIYVCSQNTDKMLTAIQDLTHWKIESIDALPSEDFARSNPSWMGQSVVGLQKQAWYTLMRFTNTSVIRDGYYPNGMPQANKLHSPMPTIRVLARKNSQGLIAFRFHVHPNGWDPSVPPFSPADYSIQSTYAASGYISMQSNVSYKFDVRWKDNEYRLYLLARDTGAMFPPYNGEYALVAPSSRCIIPSRVILSGPTVPIDKSAPSTADGLYTNGWVPHTSVWDLEMWAIGSNWEHMAMPPYNTEWRSPDFPSYPRTDQPPHTPVDLLPNDDTSNIVGSIVWSWKYQNEWGNYDVGDSDTPILNVTLRYRAIGTSRWTDHVFTVGGNLTHVVTNTSMIDIVVGDDLQYNTTYEWTIQVSDGNTTVDSTELAYLHTGNGGLVAPTITAGDVIGLVGQGMNYTAQVEIPNGTTQVQFEWMFDRIWPQSTPDESQIDVVEM